MSDVVSHVAETVERAEVAEQAAENAANAALAAEAAAGQAELRAAADAAESIAEHRHTVARLEGEVSSLRQELQEVRAEQARMTLLIPPILETPLPPPQVVAETVIVEAPESAEVMPEQNEPGSGTTVAREKKPKFRLI